MRASVEEEVEKKEQGTIMTTVTNITMKEWERKCNAAEMPKITLFTKLQVIFTKNITLQ